MTTLLERIDAALAVVSRTRGDLARHLGVSTQAISGLARSATATMKPDNIARAAAWLKCDCAWLCGAVDAPYVPDTYAQLSELARDVVELVEQLDDNNKRMVFRQVYSLWKARPGATKLTQVIKANYGHGTTKQLDVKQRSTSTRRKRAKA